MPIVSPKTGRIYWTAYTQPEGDSDPVDPLRFDMYAQRLGNVLLPGITNRVERLRYFGMVCAGLALTRPDRFTSNPREHVRLWKQRFLPYEAAWALSNLVAVDGDIKDGPPLFERPRLKDEFKGLRGANRVLAYYRSVRDKTYIKPSGYRLLKAQESQGGLGAYLVALRTHGFVQHDRFELTALGQEVARAFLGDVSRKASRLLSRQAEARRTLRAIGEALLLSSPSRDEASLVSAALFERGGDVAALFRKIPERMRSRGSAEQALARIAKPQGDHLERAAQYALTFDPFRRAALSAFVELGYQLVPRGTARLRDLDTSELDKFTEEARGTARPLAALPTVSGLEPVAALAHRVADSRSGEDALNAIVSFHHQEGRRWIDFAGTNHYVLGTHGAFDLPSESFHGYTLPSAMRIYRDAVEAAA